MCYFNIFVEINSVYSYWKIPEELNALCDPIQTDKKADILQVGIHLSNLNIHIIAHSEKV